MSYFDVITTEQCPHISMIPQIMSNREDQGDIYFPKNPKVGVKFDRILRGDSAPSVLKIEKIVDYMELVTTGLVPSDIIMSFKENTKSQGALIVKILDRGVKNSSPGAGSPFRCGGA